MRTSQRRLLKLILFLSLAVAALTGCLADSGPTVPGAVATPEPTTSPAHPGVTPGTTAELEGPGNGYDFISVAAGTRHTCGLRANGRALCWGDDIEGATAAPEDIFRELSAGADYTCGIKTDSRVSCWGIWGIMSGNTVGCCDTFRKPETPDGFYKSISAGEDHACGIKADDTLGCWGEDVIATGDFTEGTGKTIAPAGTFRQVSAGSSHNCGITTDNRVVCWGHGYDGQAVPPPGSFQSVSVDRGRSGSCGLKADATVVCWEANYQGITTPVAGRFASLSINWDYSCGVKVTGELECWGYLYGGPFDGDFVPQGEFRSVSVGYTYSCAICSDGAVVCWGMDAGTQRLGLQPQIACGVLPNRAVVCPGDEHYNSLLAAIHFEWIHLYDHNGSSYPCGKGPDRVVACWDPYTETLVGPTPKEVVDFSAAGDSACWLLPDATVGCVGGFGSPVGTFQSVAVGRAAVSNDFAFACGVRSSGELDCWGDNRYGDGANIFPPEGVFKSVSLTDFEGCAIRMNDTVTCWDEYSAHSGFSPFSDHSGRYHSISGNRNGRCGIRLDDTMDCWGAMQSLPGTFQSVSVGIHGRGDYYCGVRTDGTVACAYCSVRTDGDVACADGGQNGELTPPEGQFQSVSVGLGHACGVRVSGAVACWGRNTDFWGDVVTGKIMPPAGEFRSVSTGENYTCGIRTDGTLACWGQVPEVLQNLSGITP